MVGIMPPSSSHPLICFGTQAIDNTPHPRCEVQAAGAKKSGCINSPSPEGQIHLCHCCYGCVHLHNCNHRCVVYYSFWSVSSFGFLDEPGQAYLHQPHFFRSSSQTQPKSRRHSSNEPTAGGSVYTVLLRRMPHLLAATRATITTVAFIFDNRLH